MPMSPEEGNALVRDAEFYLHAGQAHKAKERFRLRANSGGCPEEVWYSLYSLARIQHQSSEATLQDVVAGYAGAYDFCPERLEPVAHLARIYREAGDHRLAFELSRLVIDTRRPNEAFRLEAEVYDFLLPLEYIHACRALGLHSECETTVSRLLSQPGLPAEIKQLVRNGGTLCTGLARNGSDSGAPHLDFVVPGWWEE